MSRYLRNVALTVIRQFMNKLPNNKSLIFDMKFCEVIDHTCFQGFKGDENFGQNLQIPTFKGVFCKKQVFRAQSTKFRHQLTKRFLTPGFTFKVPGSQRQRYATRLQVIGPRLHIFQAPCVQVPGPGFNNTQASIQTTIQSYNHTHTETHIYPNYAMTQSRSQQAHELLRKKHHILSTISQYRVHPPLNSTTQAYGYQS